MTEPEETLNPPVFFTSAGLLLALLAFSVFMPEDAIASFTLVKDGILEHLSWFYVLSVTALFGFVMWLALGPYGHIRLGADDDRPHYSRPTWYAMLFAAGMGIGLVFYGVAEPMSHFMSPPVGDPLSEGARTHALPLTFHHWGLHAWAVYTIVGACIAYFAYRRNFPIALRSCFFPIFGHRIHGWIGHTIDILAVFGTLFGLATSLGAGASSVSAGFHRLFGTPDTTMAQITIIGLITLGATISLITGVDKGIRRLSEANMVIAGLLLLFVFVVGPTTEILNSFVEGVGVYARDFVDRSLRLGYANTDEHAWIQGWSVVYWGWWLAWAPFVGMFVARISKGRTLRDFVLSVLFVPVGVTFFWFSVFGGTALSPEHSGQMVEVMKGASNSEAVAVYALLEQLPMSSILCFLAAVVVTIFFISSSDSASFVVDMLTSGGHPDPPRWQRVFWASAEGATAAALLYTGGAEVLAGLKAGVVSFGLPFCVLAGMMCYSLAVSLPKDDEETPTQNHPDARGAADAAPDADPGAEPAPDAAAD